MSRDDIYYSDTRGRNLFGFRVTDDEAGPLFRQGDIAVVNPNLSARPGDYAVIQSGRRTFLRKMESTESRQASARDENILGRVVERKRSYR